MALKRPRPARRRLTGLTSVLAALLASTSAIGGFAAPTLAEDPVARTPPRLSLVDGDVSFWRPGTDHWVPAEINLPLAPGDRLETGSGANLELQVGPRAFVRAGQGTQLGLQNQESNYLQLQVTAGHVALDVRALQRGHTLEVDTPNATFTIENSGYYRLAVSQDVTTLTARRDGRATVVPRGGAASEVAANYEVRIEGGEAPTLVMATAAALDDWDRWNYERTDSLLNGEDTRYVSEGVYGGGALDSYGSWRNDSAYGWLWTPGGVPAGWAPYTTGRWVWDPYYSWTWVDTAPWGWAPYHYGRWVFTSGCWGWAPGPFVVRPLYSPALVAFFGGGGFRVGFGWPFVGWVALGWGEPLVPWWGSAGFIGRPCWWGWGGPRVHNTFLTAHNFGGLQNAHVHNALVAVPGAQFGRLPVDRVRIAGVNPQQMQPVRGALHVRPGGVPPTGGQMMHPPAQAKPMVAGRVPGPSAGAGFSSQRGMSSGQTPPPHAEAGMSHGVNAGARPIGSDRAAPTGRAQQPPPRQVMSVGPTGGVATSQSRGGIAFASPPPRPHSPALNDRFGSGSSPQSQAPPARQPSSGVWPVPHGLPPAAPPRSNAAPRQQVPSAAVAPRAPAAGRPMAPAGHGFPQMGQPQRPYAPYGGGQMGRPSQAPGGGQMGHPSQAPMGSGSTRGAPAQGGAGWGMGGAPMGRTGGYGRGR